MIVAAWLLSGLWGAAMLWPRTTGKAALLSLLLGPASVLWLLGVVLYQRSASYQRWRLEVLEAEVALRASILDAEHRVVGVEPIRWSA